VNYLAAECLKGGDDSPSLPNEAWYARHNHLLRPSASGDRFWCGLKLKSYLRRK
jgi:hypothetical protein